MHTTTFYKKSKLFYHAFSYLTSLLKKPDHSTSIKLGIHKKYQKNLKKGLQFQKVYDNMIKLSARQ